MCVDKGKCLPDEFNARNGRGQRYKSRPKKTLPYGENTPLQGFSSGVHRHRGEQFVVTRWQQCAALDAHLLKAKPL